MLTFLHGFLGNKSDWQPLFECLSPKMTHSAIDLPGHGNTPFHPDIIGYVKKNLDSLGTKHLIGYSAGGRLALALKANFPEAFGCTIVLSGHPGIADPQERKVRIAQDQIWIERLRTLSMDRFLELWYAQPIFASLRKKELLFQEVMRKRLVQDPIMLSHFLETFSTGLFSPPKLYPDTLFLCGEQDLKYRHLYLILPSFIKVQYLAGSGHLLPLENPQGCADAIFQFIQNRVAAN